MIWTFVCKVAEVNPGEMKEFTVDESITVLVVNAGGHISVYPPLCPHQETPLCKGMFDGIVLTCNKHLWQWDAKTGEARANAQCPLRQYQSRVSNDEVAISLENEITYEYE